jgi:hypothetical protein
MYCAPCSHGIILLVFARFLRAFCCVQSLGQYYQTFTVLNARASNDCVVTVKQQTNGCSRVRSQAYPCGIFGRHSGTVTGFSPSDLISPCQYHSAKALYSYLLVYLLHGEVLLEKLAGSQPVKKFPLFYGIGSFITSLTSARQLSLS